MGLWVIAVGVRPTIITTAIQKSPKRYRICCASTNIAQLCVLHTLPPSPKKGDSASMSPDMPSSGKRPQLTGPYSSHLCRTRVHFVVGSPGGTGPAGQTQAAGLHRKLPFPLTRVRRRSSGTQKEARTNPQRRCASAQRAPVEVPVVNAQLNYRMCHNKYTAGRDREERKEASRGTNSERFDERSARILCGGQPRTLQHELIASMLMDHGIPGSSGMKHREVQLPFSHRDDWARNRPFL